VRKKRDQGEGNTDGKKNATESENEDDVEKQKQKHAEEREKIPFPTDESKDEGILKNLKPFQIKGDHLNVEVITHEEIDQAEDEVGPEENAVKEASAALQHRPDVEKDQNGKEKVKHTEGKRLLPISADRIEEIRIDKHGLALADVPRYVGGTDVYKPKRKEGEKRKTEENVVPDRTCAFADLQAVDSERDQLGGSQGILREKDGTKRRIYV
jgi:hypothetical protein